MENWKKKSTKSVESLREESKTVILPSADKLDENTESIAAQLHVISMKWLEEKDEYPKHTI